MLLRYIEPHSLKLLIKLTGRIAAVVCQKQILFILIMQPLNEFRHSRQDSVAVIDYTVHIANKAFFLVKINFTGCNIHNPYSSPRF